MFLSGHDHPHPGKLPVDDFTGCLLHKLREADVLSGQGKTVAEVCKQLGVTDKTYFRWRKTHGGLRIDQAKRMKELESENARLKKAVAELTIDKIILKEVAEGKF